MQVIQDMARQKNETGPQGVGFGLTILFDKAELFQGVQDGMPFAFIDLNCMSVWSKICINLAL